MDSVKLWHDADRNGYLNTDGDVTVGTGTFGNTTYGQLVAKVTISTPALIYTEAEAAGRGLSQRYFITYDIKEAARPNDVLGNPRYLGAALKAESFPMGSPTSDDPARNAFTLPNYYSTASTLPFVSALRAVVSAASTVTVVTEPIFSGGGSQNAPAPMLAQNITSFGHEDTVLVTSTAGLPSSGYFLVDSEIMHYNGLDPVFPALQDVDRSSFSTGAGLHSSGALIGTESYQGSVNLPFMKLILTTPGTGVRWQGVKFTRRQPSGLTGYDSDVTSIKIWKDNGNGLFDRAPSGLNLADTLVGQGSFGAGLDSLTKATILVADPALTNQSYVVVSATPTVFFVSMSIDKASRFSNEALSPANDVLGLEVQAEGNFTFGPADAGHSAAFPAPVRSQVQVVMPELNTITLTPEDISPAYVTQYDKNIGVLSMRLVADKTSAKIQTLSLNKRGTCNDSDITVVKIWKDSNDNCVLDAVDTSSDSSGSFPNLMSYGNESFYNGTVAIALKKYITVTTSPVCAFVSYDMSQFAVIGSTVGLSVAGAGNFYIGVPNQLVMSTWPVNTYPMEVREISSAVNLGVNDVAMDLINAGGVRQAQKMVPMLRFNLATESGNSQWSALRVQRTPAGGGNLGNNSDVKFIQVYQDFNQNDELDLNDINISEARATLLTAFASTDTASTGAPFSLVLDSTAGFPSAGNLYIGESELVTYSGSGLTGAGKPYLLVTSRGNLLGGENTPKVYHKAGVTLRKVDLYDQVNLQDSQRWISLSRVQSLSPLAQNFFVVYEIGDKAASANRVGVMIPDRSAITVNAPHEVSVNVYKNITRLIPKGTGLGIYPDDAQSSIVPINALQLSMTGVSMAKVASGQGMKNVPMLALKLHTDYEFMSIGRIKFTQTGTISTPTFNMGDGDLAGLSIWLDNGEGAYSPIANTRLSYVLHASTNPFENGIIADIFNPRTGLPYILVSSAPTTLYVACDVGAGNDLTGASNVGHTAGLSVGSFTDIFGSSGSALAVGQYALDPKPNYPISSSELLIAPSVIPLTPSFKPIMLASNGYPAFASMTVAGTVVVGSDNLPRVADNMAVRWITGSADRHPSCGPGEPLIDINGDDKPDNFDYYGRGKCLNLSLNNTGVPTYDLNGDGLLDFEFNADHIADVILDDGEGNPIYYMGDSIESKWVPHFVTDLGAVPSAWAAGTTEIPAMWNPASMAAQFIDHYEVTLGGNYADPSGIKNTWQNVGKVLSGKVTGLSLAPGNFTKLTTNIDGNSTQFTVLSAKDFAAEGLLYVGNEIIRVIKKDDVTFTITARGVDGSFIGPHTAWGETVSDKAFALSVRAVTNDGRYIPSTKGVPIHMFRIDGSKPSKPGAPDPQGVNDGKEHQSYALKWNASADDESNVASYEIQEREGESPVWKTVAAITAITSGGGINNQYTIGNTSIPGETLRPLGKFYTYRVRSWNFAGLYSDWSDISSPAGTKVGTELISSVSNYPNPVDTRKGGVEGRTAITYTLNDNAEVTITIYDLMGYMVREFKFSNGTKGGKLGPNIVLWDGKNAVGGFVGKGGYIVRVKASSPKGSKTITRKVGVIH